MSWTGGHGDLRDLLPVVLGWLDAGRRCAVATVVATFDSAPREVGAAMAVAADGAVAGSVSGGCVEAAVYERALAVLDTGRPVLERYAVSDEDAFAAGLTCGGTIEVLVEPADAALLHRLDAAVRAQEPVAGVGVLGGAEPAGTRLLVGAESTYGSLPMTDERAAALLAEVRTMLAAGESGILPLTSRLTVLVQSYVPPARMLVFGATDFAAAVSSAGAFLGYRVTVCDARPVFATAERVPDAAEVVVDWPHRYLARECATGRVDGRTVVCVLTHDPRFDVPLLEVALRCPAAYVGLLGSRRTAEDRLGHLRERGLTDAELRRLSAPIGLDLGSRTPAETAISVAAEIVACRRGGSGRRLTHTDGPIHDRPASEDAVPPA
ncbi:XdhC family protein [Actinopolymorpha rutila]|uniref:Xanthine dehydrogenase accessory factor n=1 Tax=Actinopolymorpha rutila TaxID=446787 RepID=A0A852ZDU4_9ACTN|nr:XdhC/CoxI family protein [Actinopolymorpha rutila]NYH87839.1 xanthine dehydrogenase accessory factor [Actinopolymorpha rutila]